MDINEVILMNIPGFQPNAGTDLPNTSGVHLTPWLGTWQGNGVQRGDKGAVQQRDQKPSSAT